MLQRHQKKLEEIKNSKKRVSAYTMTKEDAKKQKKEMDRMNMLYRQIASEKTALNREKVQLEEKIAKKQQKLNYTKQQLTEVTKKFEQKADENQQKSILIQQFGSIF